MDKNRSAHGQQKGRGNREALCRHRWQRVALARFGRLSLACLLLLAGLLVLAPAAGAAQTPLAALVQAQRGIDESNSDLFTQVVDIPAVVGKAMDAVVSALKDQAASGDLGDGNAMLLLALAAAGDDKGQAALLKPLLVSEVRGYVAAGINGGYFAGKPNGTVKPSRGSLASTLRKLPEGRREIRPGRVLSEDGDSARVAATFVDPKKGEFPLELVLERKGDGWRVVEIANAKELINEASKRNR